MLCDGVNPQECSTIFSGGRKCNHIRNIIKSFILYSGVIVLCISIKVTELISLSELIPPGNTGVYKQTRHAKQNIDDEIVHPTSEER